jgi:hypothetical protein
MTNPPNFHYGFHLGVHESIYTMPDDTAREFIRQFKVYLWQKKGTAFKYKIGVNHNNVGPSDLDDELDYHEFKNCNDSKGDDFIQSIISQRKDLINQYDRSLARASEADDRMAEYRRRTNRIECELAMERSKRREEERAEEASQKRNRIDQANAILQVDLYNKKKAAKLKAKQALVFKEWEENKKKFNKN